MKTSGRHSPNPPTPNSPPRSAASSFPGCPTSNRSRFEFSKRVSEGMPQSRTGTQMHGDAEGRASEHPANPPKRRSLSEADPRVLPHFHPHREPRVASGRKARPVGVRRPRSEPRVLSCV